MVFSFIFINMSKSSPVYFCRNCALDNPYFVVFTFLTFRILPGRASISATKTVAVIPMHAPSVTHLHEKLICINCSLLVFFYIRPLKFRHKSCTVGTT